MAVLAIDYTKHPHPRRFKRALRLCSLGVGLGILMTAYGLWLVQGPLPGAMVWLSSLILFGPVLVFLSLISYATYLEKLEEDRYGGVYKEEAPAEPSAHA